MSKHQQLYKDFEILKPSGMMYAKNWSWEMVWFQIQKRFRF